MAGEVDEPVEGAGVEVDVEERLFRDLYTKVSTSAFVVVLISREGVDLKLALEVGMAYVLGVPMIVAVPEPEVEVPPGLEAGAFAVIRGNDAAAGVALSEAIDRLMDERG